MKAGAIVRSRWQAASIGKWDFQRKPYCFLPRRSAGEFPECGETCGAVTGMMMVLGLTHGYRPFTDEETHLREKTRVYRTGQELAESFRRKYGTLLCRELLRGTGADDTPEPSARTEQYYRSRPCAEIIAFAASLLDEYLQETEPERIVPACPWLSESFFTVWFMTAQLCYLWLYFS